MDLGIGRAPGGDRTTALAMGEGRHAGAEHFAEQVQYLVAYLDNALPAEHPFAGVKVMPEVSTAPQVWLLGSSDYSGALAAQLGLRFAFAHFISADGGDVVMREYKRATSRRSGPLPHSLLCGRRSCAKSDAEAERLAGEHRFAPAQHGSRRQCPGAALEEPRLPYTEATARRIGRNRRRLVLGGPHGARAAAGSAQAPRRTS